MLPRDPDEGWAVRKRRNRSCGCEERAAQGVSEQWASGKCPCQRGRGAGGLELSYHPTHWQGCPTVSRKAGNLTAHPLYPVPPGPASALHAGQSGLPAFAPL